MARKTFKRLTRHLLSKTIMDYVVHDVALFGSISFYVFTTLVMYFIGYTALAFKLAYCFLLSMIIVLGIKSVHHKDRPQKEEFNMFMERMIASSFPSTHSLNATVLALLLAISFPYTWVIVMGVILACIVYIQRYLVRKHFVIDIIGGLLIGVAEVILVTRLL